MSDPFGEWPPSAGPPYGGPNPSGYPPVFGVRDAQSGWGAQQPGWPPPPPRRGGGAVAVLVVVGVVVAIGLVAAGWVLSRSFGGESDAAGSTASGRSASSGAPGASNKSSAPTSASQAAGTQCSTTIDDPTGDTVLMYHDRGEYNRSDIVEVAVSCANDELTVAIAFAPGVDMTVAGFAAIIDHDPAAGMQGGHACDGSNTEDFSLVADGSARSDDAKLLDLTACDTPYPVLWTSRSTTSGQTLSASVPFSKIGVGSGSVITLRAFSSTFLPPNLIDPGQDDAPDGPPRSIPIS